MTTFWLSTTNRECAINFADALEVAGYRPNSPPTGAEALICCADTTVTCASST